MDLPAVFDHLPTPSWISESKGTRAVFIFIDDMTKAVQKIKPTTAREGYLSRMYDIRGEIYKACGMDQGAIVVVMGVHRFYGAHIDLRADVDLLIALSTGTLGTNDERTVKKMLGPTTFEALRRTEGPVATGWAGWATKTDNGLIRFQPPDHKVAMPLVGSRETASMPLAGAIAAILFFFIPLFFIAWAYWLILKRPHP